MAEPTHHVQKARNLTLPSERPLPRRMNTFSSTQNPNTIMDLLPPDVLSSILVVSQTEPTTKWQNDVLRQRVLDNPRAAASFLLSRYTLYESVRRVIMDRPSDDLTIPILIELFDAEGEEDWETEECRHVKFAFTCAAINGDAEVCRGLCDIVRDPKLYADSAMCRAIDNGHLGVVEVLFEYSSLLYRQMGIRSAISNDSQSILRYMLNRDTVAYALNVACSMGCFEAVKTVLESEYVTEDVCSSIAPDFTVCG